MQSILSNGQTEVKNTQEAASVLGLQTVTLNASGDSDLEAVFAILDQQRVGMLVVIGDPAFTGQRDRLVTLAAQHAVPAIYPFRDYVVDGGLMSYGTSFTEVSRLGGIYVGRILKGEKPSDLPVMLPTKFELVINLKTAEALGITVPDKLLVAADEVIE